MKDKIDKKLAAYRVTRHHRENKKRSVEYKGGKCERCGYCKSMSALEFHHIDPKEKDFNPSGKHWNWDRIRVELDKCLLLCSNCHREEHETLRKPYDLTVAEEFAHLKRVLIEERDCAGCKATFKPRESVTMFCSDACYKKTLERCKWPNESELRGLVWTTPVSVIARKLGVADTIVKKRCKKLNIDTPPRGYWQKLTKLNLMHASQV